MPTRFRREIKIGRGARVNIGKSGATGVTFGKRGSGFGLTAGKRGTYLNIGIPGTGLSQRVRLDKSVAERNKEKSIRNKMERDREREKIKREKERERENKKHEREMKKWGKERAKRIEQEEKEQEIENNYLIAEESENNINRLLNILNDRDKETFNWEALITIPEPIEEYRPYEKKVFSPPQIIPLPQPFSKESVKLELEENLLGINDSESLLSRYENDFEITKKTQKKLYNDFILKEEANFNDIENRLFEENKLNWEERKKVFELQKYLELNIKNENLEVFAVILEEELNNEDLPFELSFDVEFEGITNVEITFDLPNASIIPEEKQTTTKAGKLSTKKVLKSEQKEMFYSITAGLALRLVYEAFRVLKPIQNVSIKGVGDKVDPETGETSNEIQLNFSTNRSTFESLDLDLVSPHDCIKYLNGRFQGSFK